MHDLFIISCNVLGFSYITPCMHRQGPLREGILAIQKEISEGDLIGDLLQLGAADVKGLLLIAKDMISRFLAPSSAERESSRAEL